MSFSPRCCSEHEFNPSHRHPQAGRTAAAAGGGTWPGAVASSAVSLAHAGGDIVRPLPADPERKPALGIQGKRPDRMAERPRATALPLRPMAELAAVRPWAARSFLFPRDPEHSLSADPVQPQGAEGTAETAGGSTGSTERRPGRQHTQKRAIAQFRDDFVQISLQLRTPLSQL